MMVLTVPASLTHGIEAAAKPCTVYGTVITVIMGRHDGHLKQQYPRHAWVSCLPGKHNSCRSQRPQRGSMPPSPDREGGGGRAGEERGRGQ